MGLVAIDRFLGMTHFGTISGTHFGTPPDPVLLPFGWFLLQNRPFGTPEKGPKTVILGDLGSGESIDHRFQAQIGLDHLSKLANPYHARARRYI